MRIALISDIHANIMALQAVMADIESQGVDRIICLGDVVGYGPHPGRCIDLIQQKCSAMLMGNHEEALLDPNEAANFNPRAKNAINWTRDFLKTDGDEAMRERRWSFFGSLKTQARAGNFFFVHASPRDPTKEYVLPRECRSTEKMDDIFSRFEHLCFIGHTHVPGVFLENKTFTLPKDLFGNTYFIEPDEKALINVGSVGQPRDKDTRASYVVIDNNDTASPIVRFVRVEYDSGPTIKDILSNPMLDDTLAERLKYGR